jgi:hypothetical protein
LGIRLLDDLARMKTRANNVRRSLIEYAKQAELEGRPKMAQDLYTAAAFIRELIGSESREPIDLPGDFPHWLIRK